MTSKELSQKIGEFRYRLEMAGMQGNSPCRELLIAAEQIAVNDGLRLTVDGAANSIDEALGMMSRQNPGVSYAVIADGEKIRYADDGRR